MASRNTLTKRIVAAATPKQRPYEITDSQVDGLLLRVQPSGHKSWIVTWARGKRRTLGSVEHFTLDQARDVARTTVAEFVQHGLPSIAKKAILSITLQDFLTERYEPWARVELKGAVDSFRRLRQAFPTALQLRLGDIDAAWIDQWWSDRLLQPIKPGSSRLVSKVSAGRNLSTLSSVLTKAVEWGVLEHNPLLQSRVRSTKSNSVVRFLSQAEEGRLRAALDEREQTMSAARASANKWRAHSGRELLPELSDGSYGDQLTPVVLVSINTGLRRGELLSLDWTDVNLDARILTVRKENAKSGKQRHIPLNAEAQAVLKQWQSQVGTLGQVFPVASVRSGWKQLLTSARISNFRFHDLRHHFASRLVMAGVDLNTVRELLGHADLKMTLRYAHLAPEHLATAVAKLCP